MTGGRLAVDVTVDVADGDGDDACTAGGRSGGTSLGVMAGRIGRSTGGPVYGLVT